MAVVVPTFLRDDKGLAHTLEHLIFTGSKRYPVRGYLDQLATSCLSNGTNAYTSDDHTNYTFTCASKEGLLRLLPVFLDHILYPRIEQETVDTEVFSLVESTGSSPTAQGVVYCEMKARQHSEADLLDLNLRQEFARRHAVQHPALKLLQWECGGLTWDIAGLSRDEIVDFHRRYYRPSQMSVILGSAHWEEAEFVRAILGAIDESVDDTMPSGVLDVAEMLDTVADSNASELGPRVVRFPSDDDSVGSVGFAWPGPPARDLFRVLSWHVLFKFLRETSSSPLQQEFVQIPEPWATDIDYEIKPHFQTIMTLLFSGVQREQGALDVGMIRARMVSCLQRAMEDASFFANVQLCLRSFEIKLVELFEDDPHESILSYTIPNLTRAVLGDSLQETAFGENIGELGGILEEMRGKSVDYWKGLLLELIHLEPVEVLLHPDTALNEKIEAAERELLRELASSGKARIVPKAEVGGSAASGLTGALFLPSSVPFRRYFARNRIHCVELPSTGLKSFTRLTNFKAHVPQELWAHLPLLQELLFQCDLDVSNGEPLLGLLGIDVSLLKDPKTLPYQTLQRALTALLNVYSIAFGMDNETFSVGYCDDAMVCTVHLPASSSLTLSECEYILDFVLENTIIAEERVRVVAENMINQIRDLQKDPYEVIDALLTDTLYTVSRPLEQTSKKARREGALMHFETEISMFRQRSFLREALESEETLQEMVARLQELQKTHLRMVRSTKGFVQISGPSVCLEKELGSCEFETRRSGLANQVLDLERLPRFGACAFAGEARALAFAKGEFTASYLSVVVPCPVLCTSPEGLRTPSEQLKEYAAISLICQLLSVTEGPIYRRIRGRGLAYDASLTVSIWNGLLTLSVNDSVNPVESYRELQGLLKEIDSECGEDVEGEEEGKIINEDALRGAKSALMYQLVEERSTPSAVATVACRYLLRGIPMAQDSETFDPVLAAGVEASLADVRSAWRRYFRSLLDPTGQGIVVLAVPLGAQSFITELEGVLGVEVGVIDLRAKFGQDDESESESEGESEGESEDGADSGNRSSIDSEID